MTAGVGPLGIDIRLASLRIDVRWGPLRIDGVSSESLRVVGAGLQPLRVGRRWLQSLNIWWVTKIQRTIDRPGRGWRRRERERNNTAFVVVVVRHRSSIIDAPCNDASPDRLRRTAIPPRRLSSSTGAELSRPAFQRCSRSP
jgi:hypothetical protein